jgi:hypothetical protein
MKKNLLFIICLLCSLPKITFSQGVYVQVVTIGGSGVAGGIDVTSLNASF